MVVQRRPTRRPGTSREVDAAPLNSAARVDLPPGRSEKRGRRHGQALAHASREGRVGRQDPAVEQVPVRHVGADEHDGVRDTLQVGDREVRELTGEEVPLVRQGGDE